MIATFILDPVTNTIRPFAAERPALQLCADGPPPFGLMPPTSKRDRRRRARAHTRGRRGARRVPPLVPWDVQMRQLAPTVVAPRLTTYHRHTLTNGWTRAALYLPEGQAVTADHCAAVDALMPRPRAP